MEQKIKELEDMVKELQLEVQAFKEMYKDDMEKLHLIAPHVTGRRFSDVLDKLKKQAEKSSVE